MKGCDGIILPKPLTKLFVSIVKKLVKQFFIHPRFERVVFPGLNVLPLSNEYMGDSFVVVIKKFLKMSSKLLGCIQYRLDKLFPGFYYCLARQGSYGTCHI